MGFSRRVELAADLLAAGWDEMTAAAIVADGTLPSEAAWRGTLADIAAGRATLETKGPAVIVIGGVAALQLNGRASASEASEADAAVERGERRAAGR
jgi:siroheme synthase